MKRPTSNRRTPFKSGLVVPLVAGLLLVQSATSDAQSTWIGGTGDWNTSANWDSGTPLGTNALIDGGVAGDSIATLGANQTATVANLTISSGDSVAALNNTDFIVSGDIVNDGQFSLTTAGNATDFRIDVGSSSLSGSGVFLLGGTSEASRIHDGTGGSDAHFLNSSTISGTGQIGVNTLQLSNQSGGLIDANLSGSGLTIDANALGMSNAGTLRASGGGDLRLIGSEINNSGGIVEALNGSTVTVSGFSTISGGTLQTTGTGVIQVPANGTATLENLSNSGSIKQFNNTDLLLNGIIDNSGTIDVTTAGNATDVVIDVATTLMGGGKLTLGGSSSASRILDASGTNGVLTNSNHTVEGQGQIGVNSIGLVNESTSVIDANVATQTLTIDPSAAGVNNQGMMKASNGGQLTLSGGGSGGGTFTNSGTIKAETDSQVRLTSVAAVSGGNLQSEGTGRFVVGPNDDGEIADVNFAGLFDVENNSDLELKGTINNQGTINLTNAGNATDMQIESNVILNGGGTVSLGGTGGASRILDEVGTADGFLNNVDNTIEGQGQIGANRMSFSNGASGVVDANVMDASLTIDPNGSNMTNAGLMTASNGGELLLSGSGGGEFLNTGTIRAEADSQVRLGGVATITGGTLESIGTGRFVVGPNQNGALADVDFSGQLDVENNTDLQLAGTISNHGELRIANAGNATDIQIEFAVILNGGGQITLGGTSASSRILDEVGDADGVLTNVDNTIQGKGQIGANRMNMINQSLINANDNTGSITLNPRSTGDQFVNQGTLRASNGGALVLHGQSGGAFFNTGGVIEALDGSTVRLMSVANVTGGEMNASGSGHFVVGPNDNAEIADVSLTGTFDVMNNSDLEVFGNINNQGTINVSNTGNATDIQVEGAVSLTGGGVIALSGSGTASRILDEGGSQLGELTNVDNTIQGQGAIGNGRMNFINDVGGTVNANVMGENLVLDSRDGNTNQGFFIASNEGVFDIVGDLMNDGTIQADLNSVVDASGVLTNTSEASLVGNGKIEADSISNDGRIAPGASVGALTLDGDTTFGSTSFLDMEIDATAADFLTVVGQLQLDGELGLSLLDGFIPTVSDQYVLVVAGDPIMGAFGNVLNGGFLETTGGEGTFDVHYGTSSSFGSNSIVINNFSFTAVPEPGSMSVLLALMTSTLLVRRRRA